MLTDWPPPPAAGLNDGVDDSRFDSPTVIGYCYESARTAYGRKKLFQSATKLKKKTSATTGLASGSAMRQERLPLAAAVHARRVEQVARERRRVVDVGEVDAEREERERQDHRCGAPDQVQAFSSRKIGSTSAAAGMIIEMSVSERTSLRPGKFPSARP